MELGGEVGGTGGAGMAERQKGEPGRPLLAFQARVRCEPWACPGVLQGATLHGQEPPGFLWSLHWQGCPFTRKPGLAVFTRETDRSSYN